MENKPPSGCKGNDIVTTGGVVVGTATSAADGTKLDAGTQAKLIKGSFASITGSDLILAGDTVVYSTGTPGDTNAYATMTGSGFYLDVRDGDVRVRGTFGGVTTAASTHRQFWLRM